ncbi:hypothetical protein ACU4GG_08655 [Streptomyces nojiriensis]
MLTLPTFFRVSLMALPEPTSREIREAEEVAMRADVYRTAVSLFSHPGYRWTLSLRTF